MAIDLGYEHTARFLTTGGPDGFIRKIIDRDAWNDGDRSDNNIRIVSCEHEPRLPDGSPVSAVIVRHRSLGQNRHGLAHWPAAGEPCEAVATFWEPEPSGQELWVLDSLDPLTLDGSLWCNCGDHGHIRNGKWEPA